MKYYPTATYDSWKLLCFIAGLVETFSDGGDDVVAYGSQHEYVGSFSPGSLNSAIVMWKEEPQGKALISLKKKK
jgi:hypothetical protein